MSRRDDDLDIPSIVPERDELGSRSGRRVKSTATAQGDSAGVQRTTASRGMSGGARFLLSILTLGMLATGAAAYLFYTEGQKALAELEQANGRLLNLENRLSGLGEDTEETTLGLIQRIDTNFSEIDKLWAARNQNRNNIAEQKTQLEKHTELLASIEKGLEAQAGMLNNNATQLSAITNRVNTITENISSVENLDEEMSALRRELAQVKQVVDSVQGVGSRMQTAEQDIESINVYRLQMNQTISTLQEQIRNLQQRVGP